MLTAMVIAMLTAITVWWLLVRRLREKPWAQQGVVPGSQDELVSSGPKVGLWVFLAVVSSLFGLFASAYMMRVGHGHEGLAPWQPLAEPSILWINTLVLVLTSGALQVARTRADAGDVAGLRSYLTAGGVLTLVFLAGQIWAWDLASAGGQYDRTHPAYTFFVLITAVHGLHLVGGLWVLGRAGVRAWRGISADDAAGLAKIKLSVQLCTLYWHWLLLVWLGLFALLLST